MNTVQYLQAVQIIQLMQSNPTDTLYVCCPHEYAAERIFKNVMEVIANATVDKSA